MKHHTRKADTMKSTADTIITKAELARMLGAGSGSLSRLRGLPVRPDGKVNRREALQWLSQYKSGAAGGWSGSRRAAGLGQRATAILAGEMGPAPAVAADAADPLAHVDRLLAEIGTAGGPLAGEYARGLVVAVNSIRHPDSLQFLGEMMAALGCSPVQIVGILDLIDFWLADSLSAWVTTRTGVKDPEVVELHEPGIDWASLEKMAGQRIDYKRCSEQAGALIEAAERKASTPAGKRRNRARRG